MTAHRLAGTNLLLLVLLGAIWGLSFLFITLGLDSFSPILYAAIRFDIAGVALLGLALWRGAALRPSTRAQWLAIGVAATLNVASYHAFLFWGQDFTSPAIAAVIVGLNPILTTVFSRAILTDERVGPAGLVGLALGLGGIVILATFKGGDLFDARGWGELAIVAAVTSWSIGSIVVRRTRHAMDVFAFTAWQMLAGAVILHVLALVAEGGGHATFDAKGVVSLLYIALVAGSGGFLLYFTIMERVGPIRANLVSHIAPVFATLATFGAVALGALDGPAFEVRALLAFVLVASGFALVARPAPPVKAT